jgi:hypothetical protein
MSGKRFIVWMVLSVVVSVTGCCNWCHRHCCQPAQPAPYPVTYGAPAAPACCPTAAPACCPAPAAPVCCPATSGYQPAVSYPQPAVNYQPTAWNHPYGQACSCQ